MFDPYEQFIRSLGSLQLQLYLVSPMGTAMYRMGDILSSHLKEGVTL
ncbi:hypothetical protein GCM10007984_16840 [Shewanella putrefaciens]|nr:hypothetical protein SPWS13_0434 [Shewanella putrefaciens]GGN18440.1 hypothetical protein GCM10007984_16840 [Shewanella putrefaciens]